MQDQMQLPFNERCYRLLMQVPPGEVTTYKALAEALGTKAYQAVGRAMNQNPNLVIVPCHRVVNADGRLGGYVLGQQQKQWLLEKEGITFQSGKVQSFKSKLHSFGQSPHSN